ncbi:MAG: CYTH domain-containing protein [Candidatus Nanopelagicales bacterium]
MSEVPYEIERKFLLEAPDVAALDAAAASVSRIVQTYLATDDGSAERVRRRHVHDAAGDRVQLTTTRKVGVSAGVVEEYERELDEEEYAELLQRSDPQRHPVVKTRWVVPHAGRTIEVDHLEQPRDLWLLEVELPQTDDLQADLEFPAYLAVTAEVTGDDRYSNKNLALPEDAP